MGDGDSWRVSNSEETGSVSDSWGSSDGWCWRSVGERSWGWCSIGILSWLSVGGLSVGGLSVGELSWCWGGVGQGSRVGVDSWVAETDVRFAAAGERGGDGLGLGGDLGQVSSTAVDLVGC